MKRQLFFIFFGDLGNGERGVLKAKDVGGESGRWRGLRGSGLRSEAEEVAVS